MDKKILIILGIVGILIICVVIGLISGFFLVKATSSNVQADACSLLAKNSDHDSCYLNLAQQYRDPSYCANIIDSSIRNNCETQIYNATER